MGHFEVIVMGVSAGGLKTLPRVVAPMPPDFGAAVVVVQHVGAGNDQSYYLSLLAQKTALSVLEAVEREPVMPGHLYLAPADYHLMVEPTRQFSLSADAKVNYSRPSIDVLFESAARVYGKTLIGVVLTGASADGAQGLACIKSYGGLTVVQDPATAESTLMPTSAIQACEPDRVIALEEMGPWLVERVEKGVRYVV